MGSPPALRRRAGGGGWVTGAPLPAPPPRAAPAPGSRTAPLWRALLCMRPQQSYSSYSGRRPYLAAVLDRIKGCFSKKGPWAAKKQQEKQPEKRQGGKLQCAAAAAAVPPPSLRRWVVLLELCRAAAVAPAAPLWTVLHPRAITLDEIESQSRMKATFLAWMLLDTFNTFTLLL